MSDDAEMMPFYVAANAALRRRAEAAEALAGDLAQACAEAEAEIDALRARAEALEREVAQARAEGEAAGRAAERADTVAYLRTHSDVAPRDYGGQHVESGPSPSVARFILREAVPDIEAGEHVGAAGVRHGRCG